MLAVSRDAGTLASLFLLLSCSILQHRPAAAQSRPRIVDRSDASIESILSGEPSFSRFNDIHTTFSNTLVGLPLAGPGATVFVPTNAAFFDTLDPLIASQIEEDVWYEQRLQLYGRHGLADSISIAVFDAYQEIDLGRYGVLQVYGTPENATDPVKVATVEGNATVVSTIRASNGVIHVVDAVLTDDWMYTTVKQQAINTPDFSLFIGYLEEEGLLDLLDNNTYSLFAAPNQAMEVLLQDPIRGPLFNNSVYRRNQLLHHIAIGPYDFFTMINPPSQPVSALGEPLIFVPLDLPESPEFEVAVNYYSFVETEFELVRNGFLYTIDELHPPPTIVDVAYDYYPQFFEFFMVAVETLGYLAEYYFLANITVIAPTNDALLSVPGYILDNFLLPGFEMHADEFLLRPIIMGDVVTSDRMVDNFTISSSFYNTEYAFSRPSPDVILVNDKVDIAVADLMSYNPGVIHGTSDVVGIPWFYKSIVDVARESGAFSQLVSLLQTSTAFFDELNGELPHTVLAPPDYVFEELAANNTDAFDALLGRPDIIIRILEAHTAIGAVPSFYLNPGENQFETVGGDILLVNLSDSNATANGIPIIATDILANNGIIHVIDGLILPSGFTLDDLVTESPSERPSATPTSSQAPSVSPEPSQAPSVMPKPSQAPSTSPEPSEAPSVSPTMMPAAATSPTLSPMPVTLEPTGSPGEVATDRASSASLPVLVAGIPLLSGLVLGAVILV